MGVPAASGLSSIRPNGWKIYGIFASERHAHATNRNGNDDTYSEYHTHIEQKSGASENN